MKRITLLTPIVVSLIGCATYIDAVNGGVRDTFTSSKSPVDLAVCIDRNIVGFGLGAHHSKIRNTGVEPIEVIVLNGVDHYAVAQIKVTGQGSAASIYLAGVANSTPVAAVDSLTRGCA